jgi:SAM-dependent methyltransferase
MSAVTSTFLDYTQRPPVVQSTIASAYRHLTQYSFSSWGWFNGSIRYGVCGVDEYALMKKIIQQASADQKEFWALDVGCGNFQWSYGLADFINKQTDLPKDIKVHIIGIRGECSYKERIAKKGQCIIYNLGAFKIEELLSQFENGEEHLDLKNRVHLITSHWSLRHLVDPVATFDQLLGLLHPKTGFIAVDGFFFLYENETLDSVEDSNERLTQLFVDTKAPFLTQHCNYMRSLNHFILRRPDALPCQIPMSYKGCQGTEDGWQIGSQHVTVFRREPQEEDEKGPYCAGRDYNLYGDKKMYDWLKKNELLDRCSTLWRPLQDKERAQELSPLLKAILNADRQEIEECLKRGDDLDTSNSAGHTAIHISIQKQDYDLFRLLLTHGAHIGLQTGKGYTPLHEAALADREGHFLQDLIAAGAKVDARGLPHYETPLSVAIAAKNLKAVELLIKAGAKVSEKDQIALDDPVFALLHKQGVIPFARTGEGGYSSLHRWIQNGECVVLHNAGYNGIIYHYAQPSNKTPKLIYVDINPEVNLLDDDEWPSFLRDAGYTYVPYDAAKIKNGPFETISHFRFAY